MPLTAWLMILLAVALAVMVLWGQRLVDSLRRELSVERERKALADRLALLTQHANDIIVLATADWRIVEANDRALEAYGYTLDEMRRMKIFDLRAQETRGKFTAQMAAVQTQGSAIFETVHRRKDGSTFQAEISSRAVEMNGVQYYLAVTRDITERKRAEAALRTSEARYRSLFENTLNGLAYCRMIYEQGRPSDFVYVTVNNAFEGLTGLKDVVGRRVSEVIPDIQEKDPEIFEIYGRVARTGAPEKFETYVESLEMWFAISVYRPQEGYFVAVFDVITHRKQAELALREAEQKYRGIFENAVEGIYQSTPDGRLLSANPAMAAIHGYASPEEFIADMHDIANQLYVDPNQREEFKRLMEERGEVTGSETHVRRKDGRLIWISANVRAVRDASGKILRYEGTVEDITEHKQAKDALRESEARYRLLAENVEDFVTLLDAQENRLYISPSYFRVTGWTAEEVMRTAWDARLHSDDIPLIKQSRAANWAGQTTSIEHRIRCRDGSWIWVEARAKPIPGPDDRMMQLLIWAHDITERKEAGERVLRAKEEWERTFNAVPDLICILDAKHTLVRANRAMAAKLGVTPEQAVGLTCYECVHGLQSPPDFCPHAKLMKDQREHTEEVHEERLGGDFLVTCTPLHDKDGQLIGSVHVARDITARKRAEETIRELNRTLEQRVHDRTAQLEASNKELESFCYSISHDLRAPLRAINGFGAILGEDHGSCLNEEGRRTLGVIRAEAERMGQLVDDLLAFSRIGRQAMQMTSVDMGALAQRAFDECAAAASGRDIRFKLHPLPPAQGDAALLPQVWVNLISNAIKYTRPKPVAEIEVTGCVEGGELIYRVKDNGVGFDTQYAAKLFGVFQRLHNETDFEGTGVGLALVQRIVLRHGGRVWAESTLNESATFHFALPAGK
ncbi:MAG: PAS domain S-box protein [Verrucomicrobia bacterium]|nr:PAS domain S-box protein [Verrucomicrobiota bacterium]